MYISHCYYKTTYAGGHAEFRVLTGNFESLIDTERFKISSCCKIEELDGEKVVLSINGRNATLARLTVAIVPMD